MKKGAVITLILSVFTTLAACGAASNTSTGSGDAASEEETLRQAFGKVLWDIYQQGILPNGSTLDYTDMESAANNSFAVIDIDNDGQDELLLMWESASMAGMTEIIFGYEGGAVYMELAEFPSQTYYDNGIVEVAWSHNQGLAGTFWPFNVYCYDAKNDIYQSYGGVDAWDKNVAEENYKGVPFPADIDVDGDGIVYYIFPADWNGQYEDIPLVDGAEYEKWRNAYIAGAEKIEISLQKLTEENIAALGYPKPDISLPQPVG
ncbi:MAG: hypothetical protein K2K63_15290 [Acetatifactor sp.]|nr:hypothetical protein [Acetatifactor sp.]